MSCIILVVLHHFFYVVVSRFVATTEHVSVTSLIVSLLELRETTFDSDSTACIQQDENDTDMKDYWRYDNIFMTFSAR